MSNSRNLCILLRHSFCRIDNHKHYVCSFHGCYRTDNTVAFQFFFDFILSAKSCRINKNIFFSVMKNFSINGVSCCSRDIRDDYSILSEQFIDNRRLSDVRFPYDRNPRAVIIFRLSASFRKVFRDNVKHIAKSQSGCCRDRNRIPDTKIIKLIYICHIFVKIIHFIYNKDNRLSGSSEHVRDFRIRIHKSLLHISYKNNNIRRINRNLSLLSHL